MKMKMSETNENEMKMNINGSAISGLGSTKSEVQKPRLTFVSMGVRVCVRGGGGRIDRKPVF
jgi:hypothetical protein